jgi:exopolysaccharide biosynthesis polyprenyl glycosylphosphotransferase
VSVHPTVLDTFHNLWLGFPLSLGGVCVGTEAETPEIGDGGNLFGPQGADVRADVHLPRDQFSLNGHGAAAGRGSRARSHRCRGRQRVLALSDGLTVAVALVTVQVFFGEADERPNGVMGLAALIFAVSIWLLIAALAGQYDRRSPLTTRYEAGTSGQLVSMASLMLFGGAYLVGWRPPVAELLAFWALALVLVPLGRTLSKAGLRRQGTSLQNTVIIGTGTIGQLLADKILRHRELGLNLLGFVDVDLYRPSADSISLVNRVPHLGRVEDLSELVHEHHIDRVFVAFTKDRHPELLDIIRVAKRMDVEFEIVPRLFEAIGPNASFHTIEGLPMIGLHAPRPGHAGRAAKRIVDIVLSGLGLVLLAPMYVYIAARIKLDSTGPVLYRHVRLGRNGKPFTLYKFRTMHAQSWPVDRGAIEDPTADRMQLVEDAAKREEFGARFKLRDDPRVTSFGRVLRRTSLDELPQLLNVFLGQLSMVGPRPIVTEEIPLYGPHIATLFSVPPGLTGYWQINGRSDVSYPERIRLDMSYVSDWSLALDMVIIAKTLGVLVAQRGAY